MPEMKKYKKTFLNLSSFDNEEKMVNPMEQELLEDLLEFSRQTYHSSVFYEQIVTILKRHPLFSDKKIALWYVSSQNAVHFIEEKKINKNLKQHLTQIVTYTNEWYFLKTQTSQVLINEEKKIQLDVYLEKTPHCILGLSIWFSAAEGINQLATPFFKNLFSLISLLLMKTYYSELLQQLIEQQKKTYETLLHKQTLYDELTHLPNRFYGYNHLEQALINVQKNNKYLAVLFLDLDEFKQVNDSLGHETGDLLLKIIAKRLASLMNKKNTLIRLGGDEFMIITEQFTDKSWPLHLAKKCQKVCLKPLKVNSHELFISSSIGIAIYPEHGIDVNTLMRHADAAMYQSKMRGKNNCTVFTNTIHETSIDNMRLKVELHQVLDKVELHQVLDKDELAIYYQPIITIQDDSVFAIEALLRWQSNTFGLVMPDQIIPMAEDTGLIVPLGYWILKKVCSHIKKWQKLTTKFIKIAVNISIVQLKQYDFVEQVSAILKANKVAPESLIFEITESAFIDDSSFILSQLKRLNQIKIDCSLDDFGMGYSSLSYLRSYPFKILKIDKSFIQKIDINEADRCLVHTMINMSKNLNLSVIAEGIENIQQFELLKQMNCDMVQGWYFSKALHSKEIIKYLNNNKDQKK